MSGFEEYAFDRVTYLGFEQSRDLYGDGSIVMVPVSGPPPVRSPYSSRCRAAPVTRLLAIWCGNSRVF